MFYINIIFIIHWLKNIFTITIFLGKDEVLGTTVGETFTTERCKGYHVGYLILLKNKESLPLYTQSKPHLALKEKYGPIIEDLQALDWIN